MAGAVQELRALAFDNQTGNFTVGQVVTGVGVQGTGTLTGTTIAADDTVTIGAVTYTFVAALSAPAVAYEVLVGATDSDSLDNLIAAINGDAGEGATYGTGTVAHPLVTAAAGAGDTMDVTEILAAGAVIATTAVLTAGDWAAATLQGGIAASGASGTLVEQADAGASGTLQLRNVVGDFTDNELITDPLGGSALVNGVITAPRLTPSDAIILQGSAATLERHDLVQMLEAFASKIASTRWHADNGLIAFRLGRGEQLKDVERLGALAFDGQTGNFTVGETITGGTSGATGVLIEQTDAGADGTLILNEIDGIFVNNEAITDSGAGAAVANGAQTIPLLTPAAGELILQIDAVDMTKAEALECLRQIGLYAMANDWPARAVA